MGGEPPPKMTAFVVVELETSSHVIQFVSLQHFMTLSLLSNVAAQASYFFFTREQTELPLPFTNKLSFEGSTRKFILPCLDSSSRQMRNLEFERKVTRY